MFLKLSIISLRTVGMCNEIAPSGGSKEKKIYKALVQELTVLQRFSTKFSDFITGNHPDYPNGRLIIKRCNFEANENLLKGEIESLIRLKDCPYVPIFYGNFHSDRRVHVVMEYIKAITLENLIDSPGYMTNIRP